MSQLRADSPVQYVKGVGPVMAQRLATLGIHTVADLLEYFPFRHEAEVGLVDIAELRPGVSATVRGEVLHFERSYGRAKAIINDGTAECTLRWFQTRYVPRGLCRGAIVVASGKVTEYNCDLELIQPRVQVFPPDTLLTQVQAEGGLVGVYRSNAQVKSSQLRRIVASVLAAGRLPVEEILPPELLARHGLPPREQALRDMHRPRDPAALELARRRLAYEEFLLMELALALRRYKHNALQRGRRLFVTPEIDRRIRRRFPFELTAAQDRAIREIAADIESGRPMTRLLQGDVGSGKTVVALYACLAAVANGRQATIMAPTEILAQQHFAKIEQYLAGSRVRRALLRGGLSRKARSELLARIEAGQIDLVVGTQALLEKDVAFADLAMVIVDEQHKFGVLQRADIRTKGPAPHYLVMTATPIPRTLAMTVFGDLDVSIIDAMPPGRGRIETTIVTPGRWEAAMRRLRQRLEAGEQAYVVCPLIGQDEPDESAAKQPAANLVSALQMHERLLAGPWRGLRVGLLHGALRPAEKQATIEAFRAGELHAVVATTVVEVGVDVANATIMVIENADRFGLSQLHQLRGRVGRGSRDSLCVLVPRSRGAKAAERLKVMTETTDGFRIAEADLKLRGPGELLGTRQHGLPELRVGDLVGDFALLEQARRDAFEIVRRDPQLSRPEHSRLIPALRRLMGGKLALLDAG